MNNVSTGFGKEEAAMQAYFREGEAKAVALNNRGPLRFTATGQLDPAIIDAYRRTGFYVFEGMLAAPELAEVKADVHEMLERLPIERDSPVDCKGRPALGVGLATPVITWSKPLGDPLGGTGLAGGRAPVKMIEPEAAANLPKEIPFVILAPLQFSEPLLRVYGHPGLLAVAAAVNGEDFAPFSETIIIKKPGQGGSFAWHQDGTTHWNSAAWDQDIHGVNFMVQFYDCTAANSVWFVPGSHALGKVDIKHLVESAGGNRLPQAVPLICKAGDVAISNRQIVHGSFPNTSNDWRMTLTLGFHRRSAVVDVQTRNVFGDPVTYDAETVRRRAEIIGYAIDARRQRFPNERSYRYRPQFENDEHFQWSEEARGKITNYQVRDLFI